MPEYSVLTVIAVLGVVAVETWWLRTRLFRRVGYWVAMAIVFVFQVLVDGWLTRLDDPVVGYAPQHFSGLRFPWDIPVEDFGFGFALVTLAMLLWVRRDLGQDAPGGPRTDRRKADV